jgi:hypothetical protein
LLRALAVSMRDCRSCTSSLWVPDADILSSLFSCSSRSSCSLTHKTTSHVTLHRITYHFHIHNTTSHITLYSADHIRRKRLSRKIGYLEMALTVPI